MCLTSAQLGGTQAHCRLQGFWSERHAGAPPPSGQGAGTVATVAHSAPGRALQKCSEGGFSTTAITS